MQGLDRQAAETFAKLTDGLTEASQHRTLDNAPGAYMAVHVEVIGQTGLGLLVSVAHYYEQCGDMMADPDVVFLVGTDGIYPTEITQHGVGLYRRVVRFDGGKLLVQVRPQADLVAFCDGWMRNIAEQQKL
jgi:hypothetical protein